MSPDFTLPRDPFPQNIGAKEVLFALIGSSRMRYTVPHLEALGVNVTDFSYSTPGWIPNHKSGPDLFDWVAAAVG